jgi:hypothetical protein
MSAMDDQQAAAVVVDIPDYPPEAILRPISDEERARHVWYGHPSTTTAVLCPTPRCGAFLAALSGDSGGTLRSVLIRGKKGHVAGHWRVWEFRPKRNGLHRYDKMAQVPLSGRPGRIKLQCPDCYGMSKIVAAASTKRGAKPLAKPRLP